MLIEDYLRSFSVIKEIRNGMVSEAVIDLNGNDSIDTTQYSEVYLDLISAIQGTRFTDDEYTVLNFTMDGYNYSEIAGLTGINRLTVARLFANVCIKLARILGPEYKTNIRELRDE